MSLLKKIFKGVKKVAKVGVRGLAAAGNPYAMAATSFSAPARQTMAQSMGFLPPLATLGGGLATAGRVAGQVATRIARGRYPAWVTNILIAGGTIVGGMLYDKSGQAIGPVPKRPRSKGITGRELKSFTRVTGILNKYCKTPPPVSRRGRGYSKGKSCR
jgi:hypothetical protein